MPSVNANLEALIALLDERTGATNTLLTSIAEKQDTTITAINSLSDRVVEVRELSNSMLFQLTLVQEWDLNALITSKFNDMYELVGLIDNNLGQLKTGWANFGWPMLENIFYAVNQNNTSVYSGIECVDCDRPTLLPVPNGFFPSSGSIHCQRVQYYINTLLNNLGDFITRFTSGVTLTTGAAEILLLAGVIPGVAVGSLPFALLTAVVSFGAIIWKDRLLLIASAIEENYDALVSALYGAADANAAVEAWNGWVDTYIPFSEDWQANSLAKIWGNILFMNVLYDETVEWDIDGYDGAACEPDTGEFTVLNSRQGVIADLITPGATLTQTEAERPWREITASLGSGLNHEADHFSLQAEDFVEGMSGVGAPYFAGYWDANYTNVRIRVASADGTINIVGPSGVVVTLGPFYTEIGDFDIVGARIVGDIGADPFTLHGQRFSGGTWGPF
jgi:hypothetical protein